MDRCEVHARIRTVNGDIAVRPPYHHIANGKPMLKKLIICVVGAAVFAGPSLAQSVPQKLQSGSGSMLVDGYVPTALEWIAAFVGKQDVILPGSIANSMLAYSCVTINAKPLCLGGSQTLAPGDLGLGTGVATALGNTLNATGGVVGYSGALGAPTQGVLTNLTGLPLSTGVSGTLQAAQEPAHTGDVTNSAGSLVLTLASGAAAANLAGSPSISLSPTSGMVQLGNANIYAHGSVFGSTTAYQASTTARSNENIATIDARSQIGGIGLLGSSRTSDSGVVGGQQVIGVHGWANNDNTSAVQTAYAGYFEAMRQPGTGITQGVEIDVPNFGSTVDLTTANYTAAGLTATNWLACGGGYNNTTPCSAAMVILTNPGATLPKPTFEAGIIFGAGSVTPIAGQATAIEMPPTYKIVWQNASGTNVAQLRSDATLDSLSQVFANNNIVWQDNTTASTVATLTNAGVFTTIGAASVNGLTSSASTSFTGGYVSAQNNVATIYPGLGSGFSMGWNFSNGSGEGDFFNTFTAAGSSFGWYQMTAASTATPLATLSPTGVYAPSLGVKLPALTYSQLPTCNTANQGFIGYISDASAAISAWAQTVVAGGGSNKAFVSCDGSAWVAFSK